MDRFELKHEVIDDKTGRLLSYNVCKFDGVCLETDYGASSGVDILTKVEEFLRGSGFNFDGHIIIKEEVDEETCK